MEFLSTTEVGERLGVTRRQVQKMMRAGRLPYVRDGRLLKIPRRAWEQFLDGRAEDALSKIKEAAHG